MDEYRPIVGFEGLYEINSSGEIRSLARKSRERSGSWLGSRDLLTAATRARSVVLYRDDKAYTRRPALLVAAAWPELEAFEGKPLRRALSDEQKIERRRECVQRYADKSRGAVPRRAICKDADERVTRRRASKRRHKEKARAAKPDQPIKETKSKPMPALARVREPLFDIHDEADRPDPKTFRTTVDFDKIKVFADRGLSVGSIAAAFRISVGEVEAALA
jgi:hypothetical protein